MAKRKEKKERFVSKSMVSFNQVLFLLSQEMKKFPKMSRKKIINILDELLTTLKLLNRDNIREGIDAGDIKLD